MRPDPKALCLGLVVSVFTLVLASFYVQPDLIFENSDFERGDLSGWTAELEAFGNQPTFGDNSLARGKGASHLQGNFWVGTGENRRSPGSPAGGVQSDKLLGRLISSPFVIRKSKISFLIGGGDGSLKTGVSLVVDGFRVKHESGQGRHLDGEAMRRVTWDVHEWRGKGAFLLVEDDSTETWGHINADDFRYA